MESGEKESMSEEDGEDEDEECLDSVSGAEELGEDEINEIKQEDSDA